MQVGLIGLGAIGQGVARNIAKAGLLTTVFNRTQDTALKFATELGIETSLSPQLLAKQVDFILLCVSADEDVLEIVHAVSQSITPGSILIDLSTVSSETAQKAAAILSKKQAHFLDAPVSGGVEGANNGTLAVMVGGDATILEKARPILQTMSSRIIHMGETGTGQGTKAVNQIMAAGINQAVTEALAFAQAQGLDMEKVIDVISGGAAGNWFLQHRGLSMINEKFKAGFKLSLHHKDLKICEKMAQINESPVPLVNKTINDYEILIEQGFADKDISALYHLKKQ